MLKMTGKVKVNSNFSYVSNMKMGYSTYSSNMIITIEKLVESPEDHNK